MAQQMLATPAAGHGDTSPTKIKVQYGPDGPILDDVYRVLAMEVPDRNRKRPSALSWQIVRLNCLRTPPPFIQPERCMTEQERQQPVVCDHIFLGKVKLCFFARLDPNMPHCEAAANAQEVVEAWERLITKPMCPDGVEAYNECTRRFKDYMLHMRTYKENRPQEDILWNEPESQSLLEDPNNTQRYDDNGNKIGEWEWDESQVVTTAAGGKSPAKGKAGAKGKGTGKGKAAAKTSGTGSGSGGGKAAAAGGSGGGKKPPGGGGGKKPPAGKGTPKKPKRTPKKKAKTQGQESDEEDSSGSDESQEMIKRKPAKKGSKKSTPTPPPSRSPSPAPSPPPSPGHTQASSGHHSSDEFIAPAAASTLARQESVTQSSQYDPMTSSRSQRPKNREYTQADMCCTVCKCLDLHGLDELLKGCKQEFKTCCLHHRQMLYTALLIRGVRDKQTSQDKRFEAIEVRLETMDDKVKDCYEFSKTTADEKLAESTRKEDIQALGPPAQTFARLTELVENRFELLRRCMRHVPDSEGGKNFIRDYLDLICDDRLYERFYAEKTHKDKVDYTQSGELYIFGVECFKFPGTLQSAMEEHCLAKWHPYFKEGKFREQFLRFLEGRRKILRIHCKNYLKFKMSQPNYHILLAAVWWNEEKKCGVFDNPAPLWDDSTKEEKNAYYRRYQPAWLKAVQDHNITEHWATQQPGYKDSTYTGSRGILQKKPVLEPKWL